MGKTFSLSGEKLSLKMIHALNVLCRYKGRFKQFHKGYDPVYITFLTKDNILYNVNVINMLNINEFIYFIFVY